jgi:hypothetical protein
MFNLRQKLQAYFGTDSHQVPDLHTPLPSPSTNNLHGFMDTTHSQVTFNSLSHWISEAVKYTKTETVRSYLTGLHSHHVDRGLPTTVFEDE